MRRYENAVWDVHMEGSLDGKRAVEVDMSSGGLSES